MSMRKQDDQTSSSDSTTDRPDDPLEDRLPARRRQSANLVEAPKKGARIVVEQGADIYFSICERVASFLNDRD